MQIDCIRIRTQSTRRFNRGGLSQAINGRRREWLSSLRIGEGVQTAVQSEGHLLRRMAGTLQEMTLLLVGDHPTRLTLRLDQFSGWRPRPIIHPTTRQPCFSDGLLGKLEYDAIGVKDGQCLVVEITGANIVDRKLHQKIGKFAEKIEDLQKQLPALRRALRSDSNIDDVSGLFIYLGDLDHFEAAEPSISVLSYDDFVKALKAIGLPERIVNLLDKSHIIHSVGTGDFLHDPFFAGLEDSSVVE